MQHFTQMIDMAGGSFTPHPMREHASEKQAREYAVERSDARKCEVRLFIDATLIGIYREGRMYDETVTGIPRYERPAGIAGQTGLQRVK